MSCTPDWVRGGETDARPTNSLGLSVFGVIAWIAGIVVIANLLFLAQRFLG
jgi:hypothetical protein